MIAKAAVLTAKAKLRKHGKKNKLKTKISNGLWV